MLPEAVKAWALQKKGIKKKRMGGWPSTMTKLQQQQQQRHRTQQQREQDGKNGGGSDPAPQLSFRAFLKKRMLAYERLPAPQGGGLDEHQPVVVAVHGLLSDRESLKPLCNYFAACAQVYLVDLPGHGASDLGLLGHQPLSVEALARGVLNLIKQLGLNRCLLLGHSLGGQVCMCAALLASREEGPPPQVQEGGPHEEVGGAPRPALVAAVCAVDILPINYFETGQPLPPVVGGLDIVQLFELLAQLDLSGVSTKQQAVQLLQQQQPALSLQEAEGALSLLQETPGGEKGAPLRWRMAVRPLSEALKKKELCWGAPLDGSGGVCRFKGPLLVLKGGNSPWVCEANFETKTKDLFPNSRLEVVPHAGHSPHTDTPHQVAGLVLRQLQQVA
ncbi:hypothetical protein Esti_004521 [Eimeria stiedai]